MKKTIVAVLGLAGVSGAIAQTQPPIIVTATRTAQTADEALASVTVIDRETIERSAARSLADLLQSRTGVAISRNGGTGQATQVYLRGTDASHVLVLVDGVRADSATLGQFAWQNFPLDQIERIEVVRGPRASLYGSDAIGGVIQIFTRKATGPHARVSAGSRDTYEVVAGTGWGERWRGSVTAGHLQTRGIPTQEALTEDHGHTNTYASLALAGSASASTDLALTASQSQGSTEQDAFTGEEDFLNRVASLRVEHRTGEWSHSLVAGHALDRFTTHSPTSPATITTARTSLDWQVDRPSAWGISTFGADYRIDDVTKDGSGEIDEAIANTGFFFQQQAWFGDHDLQFSVRGDRHDEFGEHTTWSAAWGMPLGAQSRVTASYGTAFKAPTVNDLFWPHSSDAFFGTTYVTEGNPDLDPERSATAEIGLRHREGPAEARLTLFRTWTRDLIDWQSTQTGPNEFTFRPANLSRVRIDGVEFGLRWPVAAWSADARITLLDTEDLTTGNRLDRRPNAQFALALARPTNRGDLQLEWLAVSDRADQNGQVELAGYGLVNAVYRHRLSDALVADLRVENLFDQDYTLASGFSGDYNTQGFSLYAGLSYRPH